MIKSISEKEAIEMVGSEDLYVSTCREMALQGVKSKSFKENKNRIFYNSSIYKRSEEEWFSIQYTINRDALPLIDFGIISMYFSDNEEEIIDKHLDLYNELKSKGINLSIK
jgi:hypothetical protein